MAYEICFWCFISFDFALDNKSTKRECKICNVIFFFCLLRFFRRFVCFQQSQADLLRERDLKRTFSEFSVGSYLKL